MDELKARVAGLLGPNGRSLCCWCDAEVPPRRRNWCSDECVHQYKMAHDWTYVCRQVKKRDKAVCKECNLDTASLRLSLRKMARTQGKEAMLIEATKYGIPAYRASGKRLWDADHIVPVAEGGSSDLSNIQTLCIRCHKIKTKEQLDGKMDRDR